MKTLIIENGFDIEIINKDLSFVQVPFEHHTTKHYERAYDVIKAVALQHLKHFERIEQVLINDLRPLSQLFFWAILSLQKEDKISKDLIIIVDDFAFEDPFEAYACNSEKFNKKNQEKIKKLAHVVHMMPYNHKVNKLCTFAQAESYYSDCETLELSKEIMFNEIEDCFEYKLRF